MPLLKKEPETFPDDLFALPDGVPWSVVHVRSRQEKALARFLRQNEAAYFLPQVERKSVRSGRQFVSFLPLFPGYVFVRASEGFREVIWRSDVAVQILEVQDQRLLASELLQIRKLQESGASLIPVEELVPGDPVEIREGAFRGYVGIVERHGRGTRLLVSVSLLRRSVAVEFEPAMVSRRRGIPTQ